MKAYLDKKFRKGFFLSEENIIKINDIITKRIQEQNAKSKPIHKIYRKDSLVYETTNYKQLFDEENSYRNKITRLLLFVKEGSLEFSLDFDKEEETILKIESDNKDFAYLLFSDLKEYLSTEVLKFRGFNFENSRAERIIFPLLFPLIILFSLPLLLKKSELDEQAFNVLLQSESLHEKLNFILRSERYRDQLSTTLLLPWLFVIIILVAFFLIFCPKLLDKVYPRNIFYIGKEAIRYDRICSLRSKFYWVIGGGLLVTLVGGILIKIFT